MTIDSLVKCLILLACFARVGEGLSVKCENYASDKLKDRNNEGMNCEELIQ